MKSGRWEKFRLKRSKIINLYVLRKKDKRNTRVWITLISAYFIMKKVRLNYFIMKRVIR